MLYRILLIVVLAVGLPTGCASMQPKEPTPFTPGKRQVIVEGCEALQKEVQEHNLKHPDNKKIADC